ncbi:hypothetical protein MWU60_18125 [Yoonia sp. F2084L]|uniref:hypothetical protein n=1 Tax=Yoonia sp. F2084L TaxID=2926419 RepID=UPI001FF3C610|nr:hypothetical protein [Yoonia sp. F2084L]MCK0097500.1 hypothetical protein [Yoonia sp. F2084L]
MSRNELKKQGTTVVGAFVRSQIVILELIAFGSALYLLQQSNVSVQTLVAMLLFCVFAFTFITGKGLLHFRRRGKALLFLLVSGFFTLQGAVLFDEQREVHLAELRKRDPVAYLVELREIDEDRWFAELRVLDPAAHEAEVVRRDAEAKAWRLAECTDQKASMAYVMIQDDVRRSLRAPSTAEFPGRYGAGTVHIGDCVYHVDGQFDAQNGFGAMLRGSFSGTIEYFPERGSWRTLTLDVRG